MRTQTQNAVFDSAKLDRKMPPAAIGASAPQVDVDREVHVYRCVSFLARARGMIAEGPAAEQAFHVNRSSFRYSDSANSPDDDGRHDDEVAYRMFQSRSYCHYFIV